MDGRGSAWPPAGRTKRPLLSSRASSTGPSAGDRAAALRVEEVQRTLIHGDLDAVAGADARTGTEPADEARHAGSSAGRELDDGSVVADVLGELPDVLGDRLTAGDREVDEHL